MNFDAGDEKGAAAVRTPVQDHRLFAKMTSGATGDDDLFVFRPRKQRTPTPKRSAGQVKTPVSARLGRSKGQSQSQSQSQSLGPSSAKPTARPLQAPPSGIDIPVLPNGADPGGETGIPLAPAHVTRSEQHRPASGNGHPDMKVVNEPPLFGGIDEDSRQPDM